MNPRYDLYDPGLKIEPIHTDNINLDWLLFPHNEVRDP